MFITGLCFVVATVFIVYLLNTCNTSNFNLLDKAYSQVSKDVVEIKKKLNKIEHDLDTLNEQLNS